MLCLKWKAQNGGGQLRDETFEARRPSRCTVYNHETRGRIEDLLEKLKEDHDDLEMGV